MTWDLHLDRAAIEAFFAEHFGDARLFEHLVSDVVLDEAEQRMRRGERLDWNEFPARAVERIEETLLALVEAEGDPSGDLR